MSSTDVKSAPVTDRAVSSVKIARGIPDTFFRSLDPKHQRMEAIKIASNDEQGL